MKKYAVGLLIFYQVVYADISNDLDKFMGELGFNANVTKSSAYQNQMAGHYIGGSIVARGRIRNINIASLRLPSINAGCGGIDLHLGGLSFLKADKIKDVAQQILTETAPVAMDVALNTISPSLKGIKDHFQMIANDINRMNINSCEMAQGIVGAVMPRAQYASEKICQSLGAQDGILSDYIAARHKCNIYSDEYQNVLKDGEKKGYGDLIMDHTNIAWSAIKRNQFYSNDREMQRMLMSLTGTVIIDLKKGIFEPKMSLAVNDSFIKGILSGGEILLYGCADYDKCLDVVSEKVRISEAKSIGTQVRDKIYSLVDKARNNLPLENKDKAFLEATKLPLYKIVNVESAFTKNGVTQELDKYAEVISIDILTKYLEDNIAAVRVAANRMQKDREIYRDFEEKIQEVLNHLKNIQQSAYDRIASTESLIKRTKQIEEILANKLDAHLINSLNWTEEI